MRLINKNDTKDINYDLVTLNIAESENGGGYFVGARRERSFCFEYLYKP